MVFFKFYSQNPTEFQEFFLHDLNAVLVSNYDPTLPTKIYAPGWNNTGVSGYPMRDGNNTRMTVVTESLTSYLNLWLNSIRRILV